MNTKFLLSFLCIAGLASCSTAYRTTQTPDDVYFSPTPKEEVYVRTQPTDDRSVYNPNGYERPATYPEVSVRRSRKYRRYDNNPYDNNYPYYGNYSYGYNFPYGIYPYATTPIYVDPNSGKSPKYYKPRKFNLDTYRNPASVPPNTTIDPKTGKPRIIIPRSPAPSGTPEQPSASGNSRSRRIYIPPATTESRSFDNSNSNSNTRTYEPSRSTNNSNNNNNNSSTNNSSKSTTPTTAPVRKFDKN